MNLNQTLDQLESEQLVHRLDEGEAVYIFKHALTQDATYQSLLKQARRDIHRAVAQTYETLFPHMLDDYAAILARHYTETGDAAKTLEYETRAGDAGGACQCSQRGA